MTTMTPNKSWVVARVIKVVDVAGGWGAHATIAVERIVNVPGETNLCQALVGTEVEVFAVPLVVAGLRANPRFTGFISAIRGGYRLQS